MMSGIGAERSSEPSPQSAGPLKGGLFLAWFFYTVALIYPSIERYRSLHSHIWDMGMYQNGLWNYSLLGIDCLVVRHHFRPILAIYALIYKIFPYGETLLVLQSLSISVAAIPLYAYASDALGRERAIVVSALYCLFAPVWLINLTNFHPDSLIIALGISAMYFQKKGRPVPFVITLILLVSVKEISFFIASLICLYGALKYKEKARYYYASSAVIFLTGLFVVDFVMPAIEGHALMKVAGVTWLGKDVEGIFKAVLLNPLDVAGGLINYRRAAAALILFGSFIFLPLSAPLSLLPALPGLALTFLSDLWRIQALAYHYPSTIVPFVFVALIEAMKKKASLNKNFITALISVFLIFNSLYLGFFLFYKNDSYHYSRYMATPRDEQNRKALETLIPADPSVVVSSSNLVNHSALANRTHYLTFPSGVNTPDEAAGLAGYVVYDEKRAKELVDFVTRRGARADREPLDEYEHAQKALSASAGSFETVYDNDGFLILKRKRGV